MIKVNLGFFYFLFSVQNVNFLLCTRMNSTSVKLNTSENTSNRNIILKSLRNTKNPQALNTASVPHISASSIIFFKYSHSWYLCSFTVIDKLEVKCHLVGETVGSFFCINSLGVHVLLEDLEKDVYTTF